MLSPSAPTFSPPLCPFSSSRRHRRRRCLCSVSLSSHLGERLHRYVTCTLNVRHSSLDMYLPLGPVFASPPSHAPGRPSELRKPARPPPPLNRCFISLPSALLSMSQSNPPIPPVRVAPADMEIKSIPLFRGLHREIGSYFIRAIKTRTMTTTTTTTVPLSHTHPSRRVCTP